MEIWYIYVHLRRVYNNSYIFERKTLKISAGVRSQYATFSKLFMFIPRFQFGHGNLV